MSDSQLKVVMESKTVLSSTGFDSAFRQHPHIKTKVMSIRKRKVKSHSCSVYHFLSLVAICSDIYVFTSV